MRFQKTLIPTILMLLVAAATFAQPICGFDLMHQRSMKEDPAYRNAVLANEISVQRYIRQHASELARGSSTTGVLYYIPVVVHVVHTGGAVGTIYNPSDAQITGAINYLNQVYNGTYPLTEGVGDIQIQFVLASKDPNCNATTGIDRIDGSSLTNYVSNGVNNANTTGVTELALKNFDRWDASAFYNIWVVNKIDGKDGTSGQFVAGYAYYAEATNHLLDGTIMLATQMTSGQKTLPHEIGHALDLLHTFEGSGDVSQCPANATCNSQGDKVCDTDPVSDNLSGGIYDFSCRTGTNPCTSTAYSINTEHNFMAYTSCYKLFTAGQKTRMLAAMSLPNRASLVNSWALGGTYPMTSFTAAGAASCTPTTSATGLSGNYTGIMGITIGNKSVSSDATADDGGYVNKSDKCEFLIPLVKNNTYTFSATVLGQNNEQVRAWIDYNNNGVFDNVTEQIYYNSSIPAFATPANITVSGSFTVPGTVVTGTVLRLRVIDELAGFSLNNACYNPTYGQAEDYPIFISASALPVKLAFFGGNRENNDALLSWKTVFEENAKEFQVEKSMDGNSFVTAGTVLATNNSSGATYSFTDKNIGNAKIYYRLKQADADGNFEYSKVVSISGISSTHSIRVNNNPFTDIIDLEFSKIQTGNLGIRLLDLAGREIFHSTQAAAGQTRVQINTAGKNISAGIYLLQVTNGQEQFVERVMKK